MGQDFLDIKYNAINSIITQLILKKNIYIYSHIHNFRWEDQGGNKKNIYRGAKRVSPKELNPETPSFERAILSRWTRACGCWWWPRWWPRSRGSAPLTISGMNLCLWYVSFSPFHYLSLSFPFFTQSLSLSFTCSLFSNICFSCPATGWISNTESDQIFGLLDIYRRVFCLPDIKSSAQLCPDIRHWG